jgi:Ca2+-binding RTX toxin-like protein
LANVTATTATDNFTGTSGTTSGDDQISVTASGQVQFDDLFDGGGGFDTLRIVNANIDFRPILTGPSTGIKSIEALLYTNARTMTFRSDQFGSGLISDSVRITGVVNLTQTLSVSMTLGGSLDMSGWTYVNWTSGTDRILITGDTSNETVKAGSVASTFDGGSGVDIIDFSGLTGDVTLALNGATNAGATSSGVTYTLRNVENVVGSSGNDAISGDTASNRLDGGAGNDTLTGGTGNDTLIGGANADRFVYDAHMMSGQYDVVSDFSVADGDRIDLSTFGPASWEVLQGHLLFVDGANNAHLAGKWNGTDQHLILSGINIGTLSAAQFVFDTSGTARTITGTANEDRIFGGLGNDTINAGGGHDRIFGDAGDDLIYGEGGNDRIHTHSGNDTVYGGDGGDQIYGGDGNDTLDAGSGNNHLDGEAGDDTLIGGSGNDNIIGGTGADVMTGGAGADLYNVDNVGDVVNESASDAGRDWVFTTISFNLGGTAAGVENATLEGTADLNLTGNALSNFLFGNSGNNVINGGDGHDSLHGGDGNDTLIGGIGNDRLAGDAGADTMTGGAGNDIYEVDNVGDIVNETVGDGGIDTVNTSISFSLTGTAAGVEKATLLGSANLNLTGNGLANTLTGNVGNNILDGGDGNDRLIGGDGNDTLTGGNGLDTLEGGGGADTISGGAGNDRIFGGAGDDVINGGTGNDSLFGETGADTFIFEAAFGRDMISGFNAAEDKLDLTDFGVDSAAELMPYATNSGAHMLITMSTGNVITIQNFSLAQVHNGMFVV